MSAEMGNSEEKAGRAGLRRHVTMPRVAFLLVILIILAVILAYNSRATAPSANKSSGAVNGPNLSLEPASQRVLLSSSLAIKIWANTSGQKVNAVQVNLSYPIDKLNFVSVDSTNSAFGLSVKGEGANGKITIARGSFQPVSGKLLVATVNFSGANSSGQAIVKFTNGTALLNASTNRNILAGTYDGNYTLTQ